VQASERPLPVSVNLSGRQFRQRNLVRTVETLLNEVHLSPGLLRLELRERMLMEDPQQSLEILQALKRLGVSLHVDDFGAGCVSPGYLKRFPVDALKIDQSFVRNIPDDARDMDLTAALIAMAHKLRIKVIAEGVETREQLDFLRASGCDWVQGNYCSISTDDDGIDYLLKVTR
jgi:EAL domain-containing protein (putative c-di-GMP-specific phosphodiesterase class I)